ncbi:hypothetical protein GGI21_005589, partial [Coemansia aciculifera]
MSRAKRKPAFVAAIPKKAQKSRKALSSSTTPSTSSAAGLSSDMLQMIFNYLSPTPSRSNSMFFMEDHLHDIQRVASVNHSWRLTALPLLYRTIFVDINKQTHKKEARHPGVRTNLGLALETGLVRYAQQVHIFVLGNAIPPSRLTEILQSIGFDASSPTLAHIERLGLDMSMCLYHIPGLDESDNESSSDNES